MVILCDHAENMAAVADGILPGLEREAAPSVLKVSVGVTGLLVGQLCRNQIDALLAFNVARLPEPRVYDERSFDLDLVYGAGLAPAGEPPFRIESCLGRPLCLPIPACQSGRGSMRRSRTDRHSVHPHHCRDEVNEACEMDRPAFVAGCEAAKVLH